MAAITALMVVTLREKTNYPMMQCKHALVYAKGDMEAAERILHSTQGNVPFFIPKAGITEKQLELLLDYIDTAVTKAAVTPRGGMDDYCNVRCAWLKKQLIATIKE